MADETSFGSGSHPKEPRSGTRVDVPVFFERAGRAPEDELSPSTVETPREKAMRADAQEALNQSEAGAPKV